MLRVGDKKSVYLFKGGLINVEIIGVTESFIKVKSFRGKLMDLSPQSLFMDPIYIKLDPPTIDQIKVGTQWYHFNSEISDYEKLEITYIRSGVVFYKVLSSKEEQYFHIDSVFRSILKPDKVYVLNKYLEFSKKTKPTEIIYVESVDEVPESYKDFIIK